MSAQTERQFQDAVIEYARLMGWRVAHFRPALNRAGRWSTAMQGDPGFPDLVLARRGVVIFAELKTEKGKTSPDQDAWLLALRGEVAAVSNVHVWRPSDWPTIEALLMGKPTGQVIDTVAPDELP